MLPLLHLLQLQYGGRCEGERGGGGGEELVPGGFEHRLGLGGMQQVDNLRRFLILLGEVSSHQELHANKPHLLWTVGCRSRRQMK